jgi:predicted AlkP superfamily pyrophosphatase or phosphodiesterase
MKNFIIAFCLCLSSVRSTRAADIAALAKFQDRPKLIVAIVIDQFRADYLTRFEKKFLPAERKGFRFLMQEGAYFPVGSYEILQCITGPGHATIMSGAFPYLAGIPLNHWFENGAVRYCAEDPTESTIGNKDPHLGTSPRNFRGTTVGDEIKNVGQPAHNVSVALKDRASILMGGHRADLAIWFDKEAGWTSSTYYIKDGKIPAWVSALNTKQAKSCEQTEACAAQMTTQAALEAMKAFQLGKGDHTDVLTISYSGHDYAGHKFGPNSPQLETLTLAEDQAIAELISGISAHVSGGLSNTTIVLTADHGIPPSPEELKRAQFDSGYINEREIEKILEQKMESKFGRVDGKWLAFNADFNFYFNSKALAAKKISSSAAEAEVKRALSELPYFLFVITKSEIEGGRLLPGLIGSQLAKTYAPGRSGDVVAIVKPFYMPQGSLTSHMTGYSYDRTVPIILFGKHIRAGLHANEIKVVDIAPTLSFLAGVIPPSLSEGRILSEALDF